MAAQTKTESNIAKDASNFNAESHVSSFESFITSNDGTKVNTESVVFEIEKKNLLVVMIGIGEYDSDAMPNLVGVYRDYCNVKYTFNYKRGYHVIYNKSDNKIEYISNRIKKNKYIKDKFKIRWTKNEIFNFNNSVLKIIADAENKFDGLIYLLSCHGGTSQEDGEDDVIYDSTGAEVKLQEILQQFSNENCAKLRNEPKIAILDFCRGQMRMQKEENSKFVEEKSVETKNDDSNKPNIVDNKNGDKNQSNSNKNSNGVTLSTTTNNNKFNGNSSSNSNSNRNRRYVGGLSDFREVYGNLSGYLTTDGGCKGGYLIRSFIKIIGNEELFNSLSLDGMIMQTKKVMKKLLGSGKASGAAVVDDVNRLTYRVKLKSNEENIISHIPGNKNDEKKEETEYKSTGLKPETASSLAFVVTLKNPLVALLCVGKYSKGNEDEIEFSDITTKSYKDYINSKYALNYKLGYSIIYMVGDSSNNSTSNSNVKRSVASSSTSNSGIHTHIRHLRKGAESSRKVKDNFKLEWNEEDIETFNEQIKKSIANTLKNKDEEDYDGLIYIISGHGSSDDEIYDSNGDEYALPYIFEEFNNEECKELRNLPKIFIIDTDRGDEEIKFLIDKTNDDNDKKEIDGKDKDDIAIVNNKDKSENKNKNKSKNKNNTDEDSGQNKNNSDKTRPDVEDGTKDKDESNNNDGKDNKDNKDSDKKEEDNIVDNKHNAGKEVVQTTNSSERESASTSNASNSVRELSAFDEKVWNQRYYCKYSHFRIIYSNVKGFKKLDSIDLKKEKGSHLIRTFTKIVVNEAIVDNDEKDKDKKDKNKKDKKECTLTDILTKTKLVVQNIIPQEAKDGNQTQIVEETNRMPFFIKFKKR